MSDPLRSFLCPKTVRTNRCTGLIKLLACTFMFIDHAGKMLFPQYPVMRIIGRLAFPMFAYGIAVGAVYTHNPVRYLTRIVALALVSQPLYAIGLGHETAAMYAVPFSSNPLLAVCNFYINSWTTPSILLSLALSLTILISLRQEQYILALGVYILCARFSSQLDYGIHGVQLVLLFYLLCRNPLLCAIGVGSFMVWWAHLSSGYPFFGIQFGMSIYALPAVLFVSLPMEQRLNPPKWLTYGFYPAHLALLSLLVKFV